MPSCPRWGVEGVRSLERITHGRAPGIVPGRKLGWRLGGERTHREETAAVVEKNEDGETLSLSKAPLESAGCYSGLVGLGVFLLTF